MRINIRFKNKGFTLIELVVVIGILGILASAALLALNPFAQFQKANDAKRKADLSQIQKGLESYYQDAHRYPLSRGAPSYSIKINIVTQSCSPPPSCPVDWGSAWQPYMNVLPADPSPTKNYVYSVSADGQTYRLYASLDRGTAADDCKGVSPCHTNKCGSGDCNFGVSSPNETP